MTVRAIAKGVRMSPRKVTEVTALIRGRSVNDALIILEHTPRRAATPVRKTVESARANADRNHNYKPDTLRIVEASVTPGNRLKRYKKGRGYRGGLDPFQKKTSHIRIVVDGDKRTPNKPAKTATTKKEKA